MDSKQNDLVTSILSSTLEQAARKLAEEACKRGGASDTALDIHGDVWTFIADSVRLAYERDALYQQLQKAREELAEVASLRPHYTEAVDDRESMRREVGRLRADLQKAQQLNEQLLSAVEDLTGVLESEPDELVDLDDDVPNEETSIRDVLYWIQNQAGCLEQELNEKGRKRIEKIEKLGAELSEVLDTYAEAS